MSRTRHFDISSNLPARGLRYPVVSVPIRLLLLLIVIQFNSRFLVADGPRAESEVKAAFLYNFTRFIEWPESAFSESDPPLVVGVLGKSRAGSALEGLEGRTSKGRRLVIRHYKDVKKPQKSHVLFIAHSERQRLKEILHRIQDWNVLTVGEMDGFAEMGGGINFYKDGSKVRFEINPEALARARLKASSKLLGLARIVSGESAR